MVYTAENSPTWYPTFGKLLFIFLDYCSWITITISINVVNISIFFIRKVGITTACQLHSSTKDAMRKLKYTKHSHFASNNRFHGRHSSTSPVQCYGGDIDTYME
jgi:hypothetical protein